MFDNLVPLVAARSPNGTAEMWVTTKTPAPVSFVDDLAHTKTGIQPPHNGTVFKVIDFPPITAEIEKRPPDMLQKIVGAENTPRKGQPPTHPYMHRTRSVDYAIILSGEVEMMLDDQTLKLKAGDTWCSRRPTMPGSIAAMQSPVLPSCWWTPRSRNVEFSFGAEAGAGVAHWYWRRLRRTDGPLSRRALA
jgi:hypothetical protein